jgi:spore maturation protein CgeB
MKLVIFGLSVSSSWGNGHATLWRGLCRALGERGHRVVFFERDTPYYAAHRDLTELAGGKLILYPDFADILAMARRQLADADAGIVTSFCRDALAASDLLFDCAAPASVFYDLDTPVTLDRFGSGEPVFYIGPRGLEDFDLVLSYTGGQALSGLATMLGARRVAPLYGCVDPAVHFPALASEQYRSDLSYLGTYAADRQRALEALFLHPARRLPGRRFAIGGAMYPDSFPWTPNTYFFGHVSPSAHAAFYGSSKLTLNVTRGAMASMGYCPSGRLFEAAACGTPILSDEWEGLDSFFEPGREILVARSTEDAVEAMGMSRKRLEQIGAAGRERALEEHTAGRRARELEAALEGVLARA